MTAPLHAFAGIGIELEYMLVDADSLSVRPIADQLLDAMGREGDGQGFAASNELALHLIEVKNLAPANDLPDLAAGFAELIARANRAAHQWGACLMPSGMHPWMMPAEVKLWPHQDAEIYRAYHRIFDCRRHGFANIQSMHLNLPFADDDEFARLHAAVRVLLPILPAIAASSPIAEGRRQSALDFRLFCYGDHLARLPTLAGRVIPENVASRSDYQASILQPMYEEIAPFDGERILRHEWLNSRGAIPRFARDALEIRLLDVQECPRADLAIAALVTTVLKNVYAERWTSLASQRQIDTESLANLLFACSKTAEATPIEKPEYLALFGFARRSCTAGELWRHLFSACREDPWLLTCDFTAIETILTRGTLARRILNALAERGDRASLQAIYGELCHCLAANALFRGLSG